MRNLAILLASFLAVGTARAQTNPTPQSLPYTQDFRSLISSSTTYPAGWQGWANGAVGAAFSTTGPVADQSLFPSATAATTTVGVVNYNRKMGMLDNATTDFGLAFAINTSGFSGVVFGYEVGTVRNPYDGTGNTRIQEIVLQYRVGTSGSWNTVTGTEYQNNTTQQNGGGVTTEQKVEYRSLTLPVDCDNQPVVQLRWAQRQVSGIGSRPGFAIDNVSVQVPPAGGQATALQFDGVDDYVTLGQAPSLGASTFTVETWFKRTGAGTTTSTGGGGITAIVPLVAKGMAEADGTTADMNYILGINTNGNVLATDFEEGTGQTSPGLNHPLSGTTPIALDTWYHAAATFDGTTLSLYLNGALEGSVVIGPGHLPQLASTQHATLGTALNSTGDIGTQTFGLFQGQLDEVRIWGVARTSCEIFSGMNAELTSGTGLLGRWGFGEGEGLVANSSAGSPNGILLNGPSWVPGSPFNIPSPTLNQPTSLTADPPDGVQVQLSWIDNSTGETSYQVERSTTGVGGPFSLIASLPANSQSYVDAPLSPSTEYCYRVRAAANCFASSYSDVMCTTTTVEVCNALQFDTDGAGTDAYVTFGNPASLQLTALTIEMWMRRDGPGIGTSTGGGGILDLIPLVAKGRAQSEVPTQDINYILGIRASDGVLAADFEEGPTGSTPSQNHPVAGITPIGVGTWHHVAATYDGATWKLYLDGETEASFFVGEPLGSASTVDVSLATALTSTEIPSGFFDGTLDEVRIWNVARSLSEIQADINTEITTPRPGLIGRWAMNEDDGDVIYGTAGTTINGTLVGSAVTNWNRTGCAPFNALVIPPSAPTGLGVTAISYGRVDVSWTDTSINETGFEIEVSTTGTDGPYSLVATAPANSSSYSHTGLTPLTEYCYRVRAVNDFGPSSYIGPLCVTTPEFSNVALSLSGSTAQPTYAGFGNLAALQLSNLTLEMWVRRDGPGEGTSTGTGGIQDLIPLLAKGRAENETPNTDINYILGIKASTGVLGADFEEGAAGANPSANHPVLGPTPLTIGTWYHVAATYDGTTWKLYLNGNLEAALPVEQPMDATSTANVSLGTALNTSDVPAGFFNGAVDEVRIWNYARDQASIQATANAQIAAATPGLVARWSLDDGVGTTIAATAGTTANGTILGPNFAWVNPGAPFNLPFNQQPGVPVPLAPANNATVPTTSPTLDVSVADPDGTPLSVTYFGRPVSQTAGPDFTLVGLPDTQYYTGELNGGTNAMFQAQTNWIVANKASRNIVYVAHLGDCVEHGDNGGDPTEWIRADGDLAVLENPNTTGLIDGIPYGVSVGNHDQTPNGSASGSTNFYNQYFGTARFSGRTYYGGHYGANNDNWYQLFSASGLDFLVISLEYDPNADPAVLSWADNLLATFPNRRGIVLSHFIMNTGLQGGFGPQGLAIYNALRSRPNLDVMMCGHVTGEGRRQDTFNGNTVYSMLSDYQGRTNGGDGWLRILEFSPSHSEIRIKTYSPWLDQFETDQDSQYSLSYDMTPSVQFQAIGTVTGVPSGTEALRVWPGLASGTTYEWYAVVSDGTATTVGPTSRFTTSGGQTYGITASAGPNGTISPSGTVVLNPGDSQTFDFTPAAGYHILSLTVDGTSIAPANSYTFTNVSANHTIDVQFSIDTFTITATAGANGGISPSGSVSVNRGASQVFTFTPNAGYHVSAVTVDGTPAAAQTTYVFVNIQANHTIDVQFVADPPPSPGVTFNGSTQYITFGASSQLNASNFTIELWFQRTGAGVTVSSGPGGVVAVPLLAKGRSQGNDRGMNYFLGIDGANHLIADYEEGAGQASPGTHHSAVGTTVIADNTWYHGAAVYDGSALRVYLNGAQDGITSGLSGRAPQSASTHHAALATAMNSSGQAKGFFAGTLDEARIWSVARTQCQLVGSMNAQVASGTNLVGRWGLNDNAGTTATNSIAGSPNGTLTGGPTWTPGAPFSLPSPIPPPADPTGLAVVAQDAHSVSLGWTDNATTELGYEVERSDDGGPFSLITTLGPNATGYVDGGLASLTTYCYRVRATGCASPSGYAAPTCASQTVGVEDGDRSLEFALMATNPVRGRSTIHFTLPEASHVKMEVLDVHGRVVSTLADGLYPGGRHDLVWNARSRGGPLASGMYFLRIRASGREITKRLALLSR